MLVTAWCAPMRSCVQKEDTPLTDSCWEGHVEVVRLLLQHGADTDHQNKVAKGEGRRMSVCERG